MDTSKIPMRKNKNDNPALRLLEEDKQRKKRIAQLKAKGTTSFEAPDTPLPPYTPGRYEIPEDIYEELELKRLKDRMFTGDSDPEVIRSRKANKRIYPLLPSDDYAYVEFGDIRRWAAGKEPKKRLIRRRISTPSSNDSSDSEDGYDRPRYGTPVLRLRGGAASSSGSVSGTPNTPSGNLKNTSITAASDNSPGMGAKQIQFHRNECRKISMDLRTLVAACEKKKNISVKSSEEFVAIQEKYQDLVDGLLTENTILMGRLMEAWSAKNTATQVIPPEPVKKQRPQTTHLRERDFPALPDRRDSKAKVRPEVKGKRPQTLALNEGASTSFAERVRFAEPKTTDTETNDTDGFRTVKRRRKKRNTKAASGTSGAESGPDRGQKIEQLAATKRKAAITKLKAKEPPRSFVVSVGKLEASAVKKGLWSDILKKNSAPMIQSTRVLPKGDIQIVPADDATYEALKLIAEERSDIKKREIPRPLIMIHDTDITIPGDALATTLAIQNCNLGLSQEEAAAAIKPLFKRGPRNTETCHWVCSVRPDLHSKMINTSVFIGMGRCRVKEYFDYSQCYKCCKYGHRQTECKSETEICGFCSGKGHSFKVCPCKEGKPKCANCGKAHEATFQGCKDRIDAVNNYLRRTSFGTSQ